MTTLMVHLRPGHSNAKTLQVAADLAERFNAGVVGITTRQQLQVIYGDGYLVDDVIERDQAEINKGIKETEAEFRAALEHPSRNLEWRTTSGPFAGYVADEARCADLLITGVGRDSSVFNPPYYINTGDLIMQLGRPALIVPPGAENLGLKRMLVGWKDTRESRRAVLDALPLLKTAESVDICEIVPEKEVATARSHLADIVRWLKYHQVIAKPIVGISTSDDAMQLERVASDQSADVIIAGAYGHSRLREWVLGGVTRDLLLKSNRCSFLSH